MTISVALAVAIGGAFGRVDRAAPLHEALVIAGGLGVLDVPPLGQVAPANLADGRPVFVVHQVDGTVEVIDGYSTHVPYGIGEAGRLVLDQPDLRRCLPRFEVERRWHLPDGSGADRSGDVPVNDAAGRTIVGGRAILHRRDPPLGQRSRVVASARRRPTSSTRRSWGAYSDDPAGVVASRPDGWVAVRGSLIHGGSTGAELCSRLAESNHVCTRGAPVEGLDVHGLFGQHPRSSISQMFVVRVRDGSVVDLTMVPEPGHPKVEP